MPLRFAALVTSVRTPCSSGCESANGKFEFFAQVSVPDHERGHVASACQRIDSEHIAHLFDERPDCRGGL